MNLEIVVVGRVQGVGYRPFVRGVAKELGLSGFVRNCGGFVQIFVSGEQSVLQAFLQVLSSKCPNGAHITGIHIRKSGEDGLIYTKDFYIGHSKEDSSFHPVPSADISICESCSAEMNDKENRRYRYPFISCTSCGPRFSILKDLPYDREHITMDTFSLCPACQAEYEDTGRRSHAQTISCSDCGPRLLLATQERSLSGEEALGEAIRMLKTGRVLAVKGIGGYQLVCVADDEEAVLAVRAHKHRDNKPLAVMMHTLADVQAICRVSDKEAGLLTSSARPIVLLKPSQERFSRSVVGDSRNVGIFLPYTGLHLMLTEACGPLVVTSLNPTDAPIVFRDEDVPVPSKEVPHGILYHEREIVTPLDDSVVRVIGDRIQFIRRSRGYAPTPIFLKEKTDAVILATGGDLKSTFCLMTDENAYISQYFGDLESFGSQKNYLAEYLRMTRLLGLEPEILVRDMHPDYHSGRMVAVPAGSRPRQETITENKTEEENTHHQDYGFDDLFMDEQNESSGLTPKEFIQTAAENTSSDVSIQVEVIDETAVSDGSAVTTEDPKSRTDGMSDSQAERSTDSESPAEGGFDCPREEEADAPDPSKDLELPHEESGTETSDSPEGTGTNAAQDAGTDAAQDAGADASQETETDAAQDAEFEVSKPQDMGKFHDTIPEVPKVTEILNVQHHHAHIASVMAEHHLPSCIGVAFDGTGYGTDGNIWGGEFLLIQGSAFTREIHLANVRIVGGDTAAKRPDTTAFCYLAATGEDMRHEDSDLLRAALRNKTLTFKTSSMGRLFDAVCNVLEISDINTFEGESAILLENAAEEAVECEVAPFALHFAKARDKDEGMPDAAAIVRDIRYAYLVGIDRRALAYAFHEAVAEMTVNECIKIRAKAGENRVALAGGVFANAILTEMITKRLKENAFSVYMNEALPPNDGSISLGQAWIAALRRKGL